MAEEVSFSLKSFLKMCRFFEKFFKCAFFENINKIESHALLTHCHGHALGFAVGETIKAIKTMTSTLNAAFALNKLII